MKTLVKVIIPLYKSNLGDWEKAALANNIHVLSSYPIIFIKPKDLNIQQITNQYPQITVMDVSNDWLGVKRGVKGYNEMMMSKEFYDLFPDTEYILICHTDAWVFRDELKRWCNEGYDLVAAPWPTKPYYKSFLLQKLLHVTYMFTNSSDRRFRQKLCGKVGNGGLCLRRVEAFKQACEKYKDEISFYNKHSDSQHNEDVFWAFRPEGISYPDEATALQFAFDVKPKLCYKLNGRRLPMGCHGFIPKKRIKFWKRFIPGHQA